MKQEFMFYIRNVGYGKAKLTPDQHLAFVKKCESYIRKLQAANQLIAAQPLIRGGLIVSKSSAGWELTPVNPDTEVQVGYYHIRAADINEAVMIAKENPEFEYVPSASIEVRPVKAKEEKTKFVYPK